LAGKRAQAPRRRPKRRRTGRILYRLLVAVSAVIVVTYCAFVLAVKPPEQKPAPISTPALDHNTQDEEHSTPTPTPLVRKDQFYIFLLAAPDQVSGNADSIMVVSFDVPNRAVGVVSIPRDTLVNQPNPKINGSLHKGIDNLQAVVSDLMGIPIDYYITVDIDVFKDLVNAVDGVDFYIPCDMDYDDPTQDLYIHYTEGTRHLNGQQALEVVRFRKNNDGTGYSDTGRAQTQRNLLTAVAKKVLSWSGLTKFDQFLKVFQQNVTTDLSGTDIAWLASQAVGVDLSTGISSATLPGDGTFTYKNTKWCYRLYEEECLEIINRLLNPYTTEITSDMAHIFQP
jgi:LCP family protein required for cell wall assembly